MPFRFDRILLLSASSKLNKWIPSAIEMFGTRPCYTAVRSWFSIVYSLAQRSYCISLRSLRTRIYNRAKKYCK